MSHPQNHILSVQGEVMSGMTEYPQPLRAIGQALEVLNIQDFEMEPAGEDYFVRGRIPVANKRFNGDQGSADKLQAVWGTQPERDGPLGEREGRRDPGLLSQVELCYTTQDVERLEEEGRARRRSSEKMPDAASLSQVLRCIGAYLNHKRARLCKIIREIDCVAIEYETSLGSKMKESLAVKDLYDLWVRMYLQRSVRVNQ
jgi:hypothetical protein